MNKKYQQIMIAIQNSNCSFLEKENNFDFNTINKKDESILDIALIWGDEKVINTLKLKGAETAYEINLKNKYGRDGLLQYIKNSKENINLESLKLKLENSQDSFLIRIAREGDFKKLADEILIPNKIRMDFNVVSHKGEKSQNLTKVLSNRGELGEVLRPELWSHSINQLKKTINNLDPLDKEIAKNLSIIKRASQYTIKSNRSRIGGFKK